MPFVVDASVALSWVMPDEAQPRALISFARFPDDFALAPTLWWFEIRNVFAMNERRGRIAAESTAEALMVLAALPIRLDLEPDGAAVLSLARRHHLTFYDAAYLELAIRERLPLATLDGTLVAAARVERIPLIGG